MARRRERITAELEAAERALTSVWNRIRSFARHPWSWDEQDAANLVISPAGWRTVVASSIQHYLATYYRFHIDGTESDWLARIVIDRDSDPPEPGILVEMVETRRRCLAA